MANRPATKNLLPVVLPLVVLAAASPSPAHAQGQMEFVPARQFERVYFTENVGLSLAWPKSFSIETRVDVPYTTEEGRYTAEYSSPKDVGLDLGVGIMVTPRYSVGVTMTRTQFEGTGGPTIGRIPRSFQRGSFETAFGWSNSSRTDTVVALEIGGVISRSEGTVVRVFGGPAFYRTKQNVVTAASIGWYDDVLYSDFEEETKGYGWGFHGGIDISTYMAPVGTPSIGVGATARYVRGRVTLDGRPDFNGDDQSYTAGGWQFGGGLRFRY